MTDEQREILLDLKAVLAYATALGALDELAKYVHPDSINAVCDAVRAALDPPNEVSK